MLTVNSFSEITGIGQRSNNEDSKGHIPNSIYIVCDGVGGSEKGEIASKIVVETFLNSFKNQQDIPPDDVIKEAEKSLSIYRTQHPDAVSMATTLAAIQVKNNGMLVTWCGDSRVYQFRDGNILFKTKDHSWVNEAISSGLITEEEAINHPRSRVITKAIQGKEKPESAETFLITEVQEKDYFMLCTDGILESWPDKDLQTLFARSTEPEQIAEAIKKQCQLNSRDNFTAIFLKIGTVSEKKTHKAKVYLFLIAVIIVVSVYFLSRNFYFR